ncbi:LOW QUALITY PROTEIN: sugar phosphate exchanger 3-like [Haliotis rubra]|uniref:LOW QUALITY PROTEIN: sugar phosphate exchanger 3-like n=1 Tax=Haliotis rubra TaxID=36100 RepID=UPI001EE5F76E|nr:LOW QUALITY PROTEIN: sugar phosphate exchanger 3-like [Haliotis rubra]
MEQLKFRQMCIFVTGWLSYASTYLLRKPLGVVKADMERVLGYGKTQLGLLDTALLLPYAFMQMLLGPVGDRFGARKTFGLCLILSSLSMITFGYWSSFSMLFLLLFINGTAQSQCWPNCTKALLSWIPDNIRNGVFGIFGTCAFAGGIFGTLLAVYLQTNYGWRYCFTLPSVIVAGLGVLVLMCFVTAEEAGVSIPGKELKNVKAESPISTEKPGMLQLMKIPALLEIAITVFCLKIVRYCMYMWLPMYLLQHLKYSQSLAGVCSTTFEVGGVLGSALLGLVLDRYFPGRSLHGTWLSILLSTVSLILFIYTSSMGKVVNSVFMFLAGAFNAGPDTILGGAIPLELGERDDRKAGAATVGLVNGFGSVGTCIEGPVIGLISSRYGWAGMFYLMIGLSAVGVAANFRAARIYHRGQDTASALQTV